MQSAKKKEQITYSAFKMRSVRFSLPQRLFCSFTADTTQYVHSSLHYLTTQRNICVAHYTTDTTPHTPTQYLRSSLHYRYNTTDIN